MQVSGSTGASAAWMLQRLFQSEQSTTTSSQENTADRQKTPGGARGGMGGCGGPKMGAETMGAMMSLQMERPSADDVAASLIEDLDQDGDGELSSSEIETALSSAGLETDVIEAFAAADSDGSGLINSDELSSLISSSEPAHRPPGGPPPGGSPPSAEEWTMDLLAAFDTDGEEGLSLNEVASAIGEEEESTSDNLTQAFSSLDVNGDGTLSAEELTLAIQDKLNAGYRTYMQQAA